MQRLRHEHEEVKQMTNGSSAESDGHDLAFIGWVPLVVGLQDERMNAHFDIRGVIFALYINARYVKLP